ncbi:MAG: creatininase family protein [Candidatus Poribacteria bacterium]
MDKKEVMLDKLTRKEVRESLETGRIKAAIIPVGSTEQHLEHLPLCHDLASCVYVAREVALKLYPQVIVAVPMNIGISEHHMMHKGTLSAKPGSFLAVLYDACESLIRHGVENILILNGHGGNVAPVNASINQFRRRFPDINLHYYSYWDFTPRDLVEKLMVTKSVPGHAQEYETAFALALFPDEVRTDDMDDENSKFGTAEMGKALLEGTIDRLTEFVAEIIAGKNPSEITGL